MTDTDDFANHTLLDMALGLLREHGPLTTEDLAEHLVAEGFDDTEDLADRLEDLPDHPLLDWLPDGRCVAVDALFEGRCLTHRLTARDIASDVLAVDEIAPMLELAPDDESELVFTGQDPERLTERGIELDDSVGPEVLVFPRGTFADRAPGDLLAFIATGGRRSHAFIDDAEPAPVPALSRALEQQCDGGKPTNLEDAVLQALADAPGAFTIAAVPVTEMLESAGYERSGELVAPRGFDFEGYISRSMFDLYAEQLGIPVEAVPGVALFASLVDALDHGDDGDLGGRFAEGKARLYEVLADPDIANTVLDELFDQGFAPASIERAGLFVLEHGPRRAAAAANWFAGRAAEADARIGDAERYYETAADRDGDFDLALIDLARYASDRGDAVRSLSLLGRVPGGDEHPLYGLVEYFQPAERPELGRNDRCWCGSGRKYKVCHLGKADHSLEEREPWLYFKGRQYLTEFAWGEEQFTLAEARVGYVDDEEAVLDALDDPLIDDVLLFEGGGWAEFLERRGELLPADELELGRQWLLTRRAVYEVDELGAGETLVLRDLRTDERREVHASFVASEVQAGTLFCARLAPKGDAWEIVGGATMIAEEQREPLLELLDADTVDPIRLIEVLSDVVYSDETEP